MKILNVKEDGGHFIVSIEADSEKSQAIYASHIVNVAKKISVPGFRKGHAPIDMVISYLKNRDRLKDELHRVVNRIIDSSVREIATEDKELDEKIFGFPIKSEITEFNQQTWKMVFDVTFEKMPSVELHDYSEIVTFFEYMENSEDLCLVSCKDDEVTKDSVVFVSLVAKNSKGEVLGEYTYDILRLDLSTTKQKREIVDAIIGSKVGDKKNVKVAFGEDEVDFTISIVENNRKSDIEKAFQELKFDSSVTVEEFAAEVKRRSLEYNGVVRHRDILRWLFSHKLEPFPVENIRREAYKTYNQLSRNLGNKVTFQMVFIDHVHNLTSSLVLKAVAEREKITVAEEDKGAFAKHIEENPWIYGYKKVESVFNCQEEVLQEFILQFKVFRLLDQRLKFSN